MKTTILYLTFFIGMGFGTMMMAFGNPFGDYITVASVFIGLYLMIDSEKEESYSQEGTYERFEPRKHNRGSN
jgi:hypothetical protein